MAKFQNFGICWILRYIPFYFFFVRATQLFNANKCICNEICYDNLWGDIKGTELSKIDTETYLCYMVMENRIFWQLYSNQLALLTQSSGLCCCCSSLLLPFSTIPITFTSVFHVLQVSLYLDKFSGVCQSVLHDCKLTFLQIICDHDLFVEMPGRDPSDRLVIM